MKLRGISIIAAIAISGYVWSLHTHPRAYRVLHIDTHFSDEQQDAITTVIAVSRLKMSTELCNYIIEQYPAIKQITVRKQPNQVADVSNVAHMQEDMSIHSWRPVVRINDTHLLIENGSVVAASTYHGDVIQALPIIQMPHAVHSTEPELLACVQEADAAIWNIGELSWLRPSCVQLQLKDAEICLVCTSEQLKEASKFIAKINEIHEKYAEYNQFDVRFDKQVIAHKTSKASLDAQQSQRATRSLDDSINFTKKMGEGSWRM